MIRHAGGIHSGAGASGLPGSHGTRASREPRIKLFRSILRLNVRCLSELRVCREKACGRKEEGVALQRQEKRRLLPLRQI